MFHLNMSLPPQHIVCHFIIPGATPNCPNPKFITFLLQLKELSNKNPLPVKDAYISNKLKPSVEGR